MPEHIHCRMFARVRQHIADRGPVTIDDLHAYFRALPGAHNANAGSPVTRLTTAALLTYLIRENAVIITPQGKYAAAPLE